MPIYKQHEQLIKALEDTILFYEPLTLSLDSKPANYPGVLDIKAALQGKANIFKIRLSEDSLKEKKLIVITDWTLHERSFYSSASIRFIRLLSDLGFPMAYFDGKKIILAEAASLDFRDIKPKPLSDKKMHKMLAPFNIPSETILNLDYLNLRKLIKLKFAEVLKILSEKNNYSYPSSQDIEEKSFKGESSSYDIKLEKLNAEEMENVHEWLEERKFNYTARDMNEFNRQFLTSHHDSIIGLSIHINHFKKVNTKNLKRLELYAYDLKTQSELDITEEDLINLEELILTSVDLPESVFVNILNNAERLKSLKLTKCIIIKDELTNVLKIPKNLKELHFLDVTITTNLINSLLSCSCTTLYIQDLKLNEEPDEEIRVSWNFSMLVKIQINTITSRFIKNNLFESLEQTAGKLNDLNLVGTQLPIKVSAQTKMTHLKSLFINNALLNLNRTDCLPFISNLLNNNPHLEKLYLVGLSQQPLDLTESLDESLHFPNLHYLDCQYTNLSMTLSSCLMLYAAASNIHNMNLTHLDLSSPVHHVNTSINLNLKHILKIDAADTRIPGMTLLYLLSQCDRLEELNLHQAVLAHFTEKEILQLPELSSLKSLNLSESSISPSVLNVILRKCPNLEKLTLNGLDLTNVDFYSNIHLIEIQYDTIPIAKLIKLSSTSKAVSRTDLSKCIINNLSDLDNLNYDNITTLVFDGHNQIHVDVLLKILPLCKNLQFIRNTADNRICKTNEISAEQITDTLTLPQLKAVDFSNLPITGNAILKIIRKSPLLENLTIEKTRCMDLEVEDMSTLDFPNLVTINLKQSKMKFLPHLVLLTKSKLRYDMTNKELIHLTSSFPAAEEAFTNTLPVGLEFPTVKSLLVNRSKSGDDALQETFAIYSLIRAIPHLKTLTLIHPYTDFESDYSLDKIPTTLVRLIIATTSLSPTAVELLLLRNRSLISLNIKAQKEEVKHRDITRYHEMLDQAYRDFTDFTDLSSLTIDGIKSLPERLFNHIFRTANKLSVFYFYKGTAFIPYDANTTNLHRFAIYDSIINGSLYPLLRRNANLFELILDNCVINDTNPNKHTDLPYPSLKTISIKRTNFDSSLLLELIRNSPDITFLNYFDESNKHFITTLLDNHIQLLHLTHLEITNQELPSNFFHLLSIMCPNLETLTMTKCVLKPLLRALPVHPMSKLTRLDLLDSQLSHNQLANFIAKTENLNEVLINQTKILEDNKGDEIKINLPNLQELSILYSTVPVTLLYKIVYTSKAVNKIHISDTTFVYPASVNRTKLNPPSDLALTSFDHSSNLILSDIIRLQVQSNLTKLSLEMISDKQIHLLENAKHEFSIEKLKQTTEFKLSTSKLRVDKLINLLDKMQLKKLTIAACTITHLLTDVAIQQIASRKSLQTITNLIITNEYSRVSNIDNILKDRIEIPGSLFIALLLASAKTLTTIMVSGVTITNLSMNDIPPNLYLPNVSEFNITNTGLSQEIIDELKSRIPKVRNRDKYNYSYSSNSNPYNSNLYDNILSKLNADQDQPLSDKDLDEISQMMSRLQTSDDSLRTKDLAEHISDIQSKRSKPASQGNTFFPNMNATTKDKTHSVDVTYESKPGEKTELKVKQYFRPAEHPGKFRLHPGTTLKHQGKIVTPILDISDLTAVKLDRSYHKPSLELEFIKLFAKDRERFSLFNKKMTITHAWRPLPSLSAFEEIQKFYIPNPELYEIKYSKKNNFYFIRLKDSVKQMSMKKVDIAYILDKEKFKPSHIDKKLPQALQDLINYCSNFNEGVFTAPPHYTSQQILDKRYADKVGACDKRSMVFKHKFDQMKTENPELYKDLECRYISNKIHAFVEIVKNGQTITYDLRGYPTKLKIEDSFDPSDSVLTMVDQAVKTIEIEQMGEDQYQEIQNSFVVSIPPFRPPPKPIEEKDLNPKLAIWRKANKNAYKEKIIDKFTKNRINTLVKVNQADDCLAVIADFNRKNPNVPYFLIDSPDDLQINSKGLKNDGKNHLKVNQKFSQLSEFIKNNPNGVIFVNWSRFNKTELTALHCILDKKRTLEGSPFASNNPIVSFYCDNIPNPYKGLDFTSRHQHIYRWPDTEEVTDLYNNSRQATDDLADKVIAVPLYESQDWENLLFGAINIKDKSFQLHPEDFLLQGLPLKSVHLINPPWKLRAFNLFWQSALQQKKFVLYGKTYELDKDFKLTYSYNKEFNAKSAVEQVTPAAHPLIVNSQTISQLWLHYIYAEHSFLKQPSVFKILSEATSNKEFALTITETLSLPNWIRLLDEANKYDIKFSITLTEGVELPPELRLLPHKIQKNDAKSLHNKNDLESKGVTVIETAKAAEVVHELLRGYPSAEHVSLAAPHDFGDLFYHIHSNIDDQDQISAKLIKSDIWKMLKAGKTVIVEGELSSLLIQTLAPLLCNNKNEMVIEGATKAYSGKLIFVTPSKVSFATNRYSCQSKEEMAQCLILKAEEAKTKPKGKEFSSKPHQTVYSPTDLSLSSCEAYKNERFDRIKEGFTQSPIIFYNGPTGIGKTTYILKDFAAEYYQKTGRKARLYIGESQIEAFAAHNEPSVDPILFIDEANLSTQDLSILKGLKNPKRHALIGGKYYPIKDNAKVILAGNKKNYGGVRQQQPFLDEYSVNVECDRPNNAYNYHTILKSILSDTFKNADLSSSSTSIDTPEMDVAVILLELFNKVNELAKQPDPYFTPRHLHMIAKVFQYYFNRYHQSFDKRAIAAASVLTILGDDLPNIHQQLANHINLKYAIDPNEFRQFIFKETQAKLAAQFPPSYEEDYFTFSESRIPAIHMMDIFLNLRESPDFHFGIALEGSTSNGKSDLLQHYIASQYPDSVVQMTLGTNFESDRETILAAFREGKILIIDEINAGGPKYEKLFNTLIMGTDEEGNPPTKRGFLVLTTQNSLTNEGRQALSPALKARFTSLLIPKYKYPELEQILINKGVERKAAKSLVRDYELCIQYAKEHKIKLKPKLRNLLKACDFNLIHKQITENTLSEERTLSSQSEQISKDSQPSSEMAEEILESNQHSQSASPTSNEPAAPINEEPSPKSLQDLIDRIENQIRESEDQINNDSNANDFKASSEESTDKFAKKAESVSIDDDIDLFLNEDFIQTEKSKPIHSSSQTSDNADTYQISYQYANAVQSLQDVMKEVQTIVRRGKQSWFSFSSNDPFSFEYGKKELNIVRRFEIMLESVIDEYNLIQDTINKPFTLGSRSETANKLRTIVDKAITSINHQFEENLYSIENDPAYKGHIELICKTRKHYIDIAKLLDSTNKPRA